MEIELTKSQQKFHDVIIDWVNERHKLRYNDSHYIVCSGYAGTGKTTILGKVVESLNKFSLKIGCVSYTGKSAQVLKSKLLGHRTEHCGTIHSLIYRPKVDKEGRLESFVRRNVLSCDILIVDECSMINQELFKDLTKYKIPIIFIGDDAQLPPVGGKAFDIFKDTTIKLTEIHRQAENSPIIKMSMVVRNGDELKSGLHGKNCARFSWNDQKAQKALFTYDLIKDNIVLCGMNKTRVLLNSLIREKLGFKREDPMINEKVIFLQNNHDIGVMNGNLGILNSIKLHKDYAYIMNVSFDYFNCDTIHFVYKDGFNQISQNDYFEFLHKSKVRIEIDKNKFTPGFKKLDLIDFGYAISVHKSQGSTFEDVILINERNYYQTDEEYCKWLYTGITRAAKRLLIIDDF